MSLIVLPWTSHKGFPSLVKSPFWRKLSTFCSLDNFTIFDSLSIISTTVFLILHHAASRSFPLFVAHTQPLTLSPLMLQSMNKLLLLFSLWVLTWNELIYFSELKGLKFWSKEKKKLARKSNMFFWRRLLCVTQRAVTQKTNIFASSSSERCIRKHISAACSLHSSPSASKAQTPLNLTVTLYFIIVRVGTLLKLFDTNSEFLESEAG